MNVKICGITRESDVDLAYEFGAYMVGTIFSDKTKRRGSEAIIKRANEIGIPVVAVYTEIENAIRDRGEDYAQLHFDHDSEDIQLIRQTGRKVISVNFFDGFNRLNYDVKKYRASDIFMVERKPSIIPSIESLKNIDRTKLAIAGGIEENSLDEIIKFSPFMVDLSSSIESETGLKDRKKVESFFRRLNHAEEALQ
ncbi:phosphoribosylanthranilate isomerase [Caldiplasma sukawensis]